MFTIFYYHDNHVAIYQDDVLIFDGNRSKTALLIKAITANVKEYDLCSLIPSYVPLTVFSKLSDFKYTVVKLLKGQYEINLKTLKLLMDCELLEVNSEFKEIIDAQVLRNSGPEENY